MWMDSRFVHKYLVYSQIFDHEFDRWELIKLINQLPLGCLFNVLSQLMFIEVNNQQLQRDYVESFKRASWEDPSRVARLVQGLQDSYLYTPQSLLTVGKWLLAHGDPRRVTDYSYDLAKATQVVLHNQLIVADYLSAGIKRSLLSEVIMNYAFNSTDNIRPLLSRAKYLYLDLARRKDLYPPKEYLDINKDFRAKYNCSLDTYLKFIFMLTALSGRKQLTATFPKELVQYFAVTPYQDQAQELLWPLSFTFAEGQTWALHALNKPWDFSLFQEKPLLHTDDGFYYIMSSKYLFGQIFESLYWKVRHCYANEDKRFFGFFGRPFEQYAIELLSKASAVSGKRYEVYPEFAYGADHSKKSPEALLKLGRKLIAVEAKSRRMSKKSLTTGDPQALSDDFDNLVVEPLNQLCQRLTELLPRGAAPCDFSEINEIHLLVVNQTDFPVLPLEYSVGFEQVIATNLQKYEALPIATFLHMNIEAYEFFCGLVECGQPVFNILKDRQRLAPALDLKNYLYQAKLPLRIPRWLEKQGKQYLDSLQASLRASCMP